MKTTLPILQSSIADSFIQNFGEEQQDLILMEECSELQKAVCKYRRRVNANIINPDVHDITEEMAHVLITMQVVMRVHDISYQDIQNAFDAKLAGHTGKINRGNI